MGSDILTPLLALPDPVLVVSEHTLDIRDANDAAQRFYGFSIDEFTDMSLCDLTDDIDSAEELKRSLMNSSAHSTKPVWTHRLNDDTTRDIQLMLIPVHTDGERLLAARVNDLSSLVEEHQQLRSTLRKKETLLAEIHHRLKNNLAVVSGLLELESLNSDIPWVKKIFYDLQLRIRSIAMIHEKLYKSSTYSSIELGDYIKDLVSTIANTLSDEETEIQVNTQTDEIYLDIEKTVPYALILNELLTNIYKHAFKDREKGTINICLERGDTQNIKMSICDDGVGLPDDFEIRKAKSLGMMLINTLSKQLEAELNVHPNADGGTCFDLTFPVTRREAEN